jgi:Glucodextranase, domain N
MNPPENSIVFGAPGIEARWTSSAKEGVGTAYHTSRRLWFTLSHGIVNEIYCPHVDQPNMRDVQFLISDGETFCQEEKRDLYFVPAGVEAFRRDNPNATAQLLDTGHFALETQ